MDSREPSVNIVPLSVFIVIFRFLKTLSITLILDETHVLFNEDSLSLIA